MDMMGSRLTIDSITYEIQGNAIYAYATAPFSPYNRYMVYSDLTMLHDREEVLHMLKSMLESKIAEDRTKLVNSIIEESAIEDFNEVKSMSLYYGGGSGEYSRNPFRLYEYEPLHTTTLRRQLEQVTKGPNKILSLPSAPIQPAKPRPPLKPDEPKPVEGSYETHYWAFVNAKTQEEADKSLTAMVGKVTMELQPRADGKSWVKEPKPAPVIKSGKKTVALITYRVLIIVMMLEIMRTIVMICT